jgi:hypothetical protein
MPTTNDPGSRARAHGGDDVERYRRAAEQTLDQLDWCISYLYRIRKPEIARALERNRSTIRRRMRRGDG